jgi:hypothetical protein
MLFQMGLDALKLCAWPHEHSVLLICFINLFQPQEDAIPRSGDAPLDNETAVIQIKGAQYLTRLWVVC